MRLHLFIILFITVILKTTWAKEGFFALDSLNSENIEAAFLEFPSGHDCGSVRIHSHQPYYLTALHCIRNSFTPDQVLILGNPLKSEVLNFYDNLTGKSFQIEDLSFEILAHGACWTGFGLDVIANVSLNEQEQATKCLNGDWVILKLTSKARTAKSCLRPKLLVASKEDVIAIGGPRMTVKRLVGLQKLNGRVFSRGNLFNYYELMSNLQYSNYLAVTWKKVQDSFLKNNQNFLLTDSDIINGMSGGPIVSNGQLIGISTVGLLPNYIFEYPDLVPMAEGYNFGIHGGISIKQIMKNTSQYFSCP